MDRAGARARATAGSGLLALWLAACGSSPAGLPDPEESDPEALFSELELAVIRSELAELPPLPPDDLTNAYDDDPRAARLGQRLFFDARFSANGEVACATCHIAEQGFQDRRDGNTSRGLGFTGRHAATLINVAYGSGKNGSTLWQFWDGRKDSLWSQALSPPESSVEMGSTRSRVALLLHDEYEREYEAIFGAMPELRDESGQPLVPPEASLESDAWQALGPELQDRITSVYVNFGKAIAAYERLIISRDSRYDAFLRTLSEGASDSDELTQSEKLGLKLFVGKAQCISCHRGPNLTDWKFHNVGVRQAGDHVPSEDRGRELGVSRVKADEFNCQSRWSDAPDKSICGVGALDAVPADVGAFKTPGLRNVTLTAPYFHTGGVQTLLEVMDHYNHGGEDAGFVGDLDENILPLDLTAEEAQALVDFMRSLTGKPLDPALLTAPDRQD